MECVEGVNEGLKVLKTAISIESFQQPQDHQMLQLSMVFVYHYSKWHDDQSSERKVISQKRRP
jgi:hypothetical protein